MSVCTLNSLNCILARGIKSSYSLKSTKLRNAKNPGNLQLNDNIVGLVFALTWKNHFSSEITIKC